MEFWIDDALHQLERRVRVGARVVLLRSRARHVRSELGPDRLGELIRSGSVFGVSSRNLETAEHRNRFRDLGDLGPEGRGWPAPDHLDVALLQAVVGAADAELVVKNCFPMTVWDIFSI